MYAMRLTSVCMYMLYVCALRLHSQFKFIEFSMICEHFRIVVHRWRSQMKQTQASFGLCRHCVVISPSSMGLVSWLVGWHCDFKYV